MRIERLRCHADSPSSLISFIQTQCDLSGADVRKGDLRMTVFEECSLRDAMVAGSHFEGSDLRGADLGGLRLVDANLFRGATISREQAGQLLGELGLSVR